MCWTALRTSDSSEGDAVARPGRPHSKAKKLIVASLVFILGITVLYPVATAPGSDLVATAPGSDLVATASDLVDLVLNFRAIAEKPGACPQSSSNECYGQIVSPKKNRGRD